MSARLIKFGQTGLDRSDVAEYALRRQMRQHGCESVNRIFDCRSIDDELRSKFVDFVERREAAAVECEAQALRIGIVDSDLMVKRQQIAEE